MAPSTDASTSGRLPFSKSRPKPLGISTTICVLPLRQSPLRLGGGGYRRLHRKIPGAGKAIEQLPALRRVILVECRHLQIFDIEGNAVAEGQHQDDGAEDGEGEPDRIAQKLDGLAPRISPQASQIEPLWRP